MFQPTLIGLDIPIEIVYQIDLSKTVEMPIAVCCETNRIVTVDSHLSPYSCDFGDCWEFSFEITVTSLDGDNPPFSTQDRAVAYGYIPSGIRPVVMHLVCLSFGALLGCVRPACVCRVTKARHPPEKALRKHQVLTSFLRGMGYEPIHSGTDRWGRLFWVFGTNK
jgi:hypothetical protein